MAVIALGLGTNLGNKEKNLYLAVQFLSDKIGKVLKTSSFYVSEPWGFASENNFLNAVATFETELSPEEILNRTKEIEINMGRKAKTNNKQYTDRIIDIDILLYDALVLNSPELTIPHPFMQERDFVLCPLAEIAPDYIHPVLNKKIKDLWDEHNRK